MTIEVEQVTAVPSVRAAPMKGDFAAISVTDTGAGIDPAVVDRIFEPFTTKSVGAGTGLGLSQVFGFVKQSEGEVDVQSQAGAGSRFSCCRWRRQEKRRNGRRRNRGCSMATASACSWWKTTSTWPNLRLAPCASSITA